MSSDNLETKNIRAVFILEIIGRPAEHLVTTLEDIIKEIENEKGVKIKSKIVNEPKEMEEQKGFYSTFAEIEVEVEEAIQLAILMFKYMPAHVEVLSPELISLTNNGWNEILNELTRRLHGYNEVAKVLEFQKNQLEAKLKEVMPEEDKTEKKE